MKGRGNPRKEGPLVILSSSLNNFPLRGILCLDEDTHKKFIKWLCGSGESFLIEMCEIRAAVTVEVTWLIFRSLSGWTKEHDIGYEGPPHPIPICLDSAATGPTVELLLLLFTHITQLGVGSTGPRCSLRAASTMVMPGMQTSGFLLQLEVRAGPVHRHDASEQKDTWDKECLFSGLSVLERPPWSTLLLQAVLMSMIRDATGCYWTGSVLFSGVDDCRLTLEKEGHRRLL